MRVTYKSELFSGISHLRKLYFGEKVNETTSLYIT